MTTIADALQNGADALNNAVTNVLAVRSQIAATLDAKAAQATTIINNFLGRPATQIVWCDPINGNDANDGSTPVLSKKSLENIVFNSGITSTQVMLLGDVTFSSRYNLNCNIYIQGCQISAAAPGFIPFNRRISFLGTALNSPAPGIGRFCAGMWCFGTSFITNNIDFDLPAQPAGQDYPAHLTSVAGTNFNITGGTITVRDATAGSLVGSYSRSTVSLSMTFGAGAAGHIMDRVAAGANPNSQFAYVSNVTSA